MSQLGLPLQPEISLPLIHQAARVDSVQVPQSAYTFSGNSPTRQFPRVLCAAYCAAPVGPTRSVSSFRAYCIPPLRPCAVQPWTRVRVGDALFGIQYHLLANQQGNVEADMALSRWFLCGAEGAFDMAEDLAFRLPKRVGERRSRTADRWSTLPARTQRRVSTHMD